MKYWLMKSEPGTFGIDHLAKRPKRTAGWDGVRNYQARNMLRDDFTVGDRAFFHHSSCETPGIYGTMEIVRAAHPDPRPVSTARASTTMPGAIAGIPAGTRSRCAC
jgi:predicted RNA-binding protein with PUA-like domain